jgi:hypothetical protein
LRKRERNIQRDGKDGEIYAFVRATGAERLQAPEAVAKVEVEAEAEARVK